MSAREELTPHGVRGAGRQLEVDRLDSHWCPPCLFDDGPCKALDVVEVKAELAGELRRGCSWQREIAHEGYLALRRRPRAWRRVDVGRHSR